MILSIFVHQSVRVWPWPNWGDKPKPIETGALGLLGVLARSHRMAICCRFDTKKEIAPKTEK